IAQEQRDFATAEQYFGRCLSSAERARRDDVAASAAFSHAAIVFSGGRHTEAAQLCVRGILAAGRGCQALTPAGVTLFTQIWHAIPEPERVELAELWRSASLGPLHGPLEAYFS
ncbi:MAG: hypothetical protein ACKO2P_00140, partial [Planctomycetota bacterium]